MKKQPVIIVGGGNSYNSQEDFLESLRTQEIYDLQKNARSGDWKKWLADELEESHIFFVPSMPNKQNARYEEWKIWFERYANEVQGDIILVGWSLGAMFLARYLIENNISNQVSTLYLLAGPCGTLSDDKGNNCREFSFDPSQLEKVAAQVGKIVIMHSRDDYVVPYEHAECYAKHLPAAELVTFEDKNHFLVGELSELLVRLREG